MIFYAILALKPYTLASLVQVGESVFRFRAKARKRNTLSPTCTSEASAKNLKARIADDFQHPDNI